MLIQKRSQKPVEGFKTQINTQAYPSPILCILSEFNGHLMGYSVWASCQKVSWSSKNVLTRTKTRHITIPCTMGHEYENPHPPISETWCQAL